MATSAGKAGQPNEDFAGAVPGAAVLLDGAGIPGTESTLGVPELTDKALRRGSFSSVPDLIATIEEFMAVHNDDPKPFVWTATADSILAKVRRSRVAIAQVNQ